MKRISFLIIIIFVVVACNTQDNLADNTIVVDNSKDIKNNNFNDFFIDLRILELESSDESRLSNSKKVILGNDSTLVILDRSIQKAVRIFDSKGKYRNSITSDNISELLHYKAEIVDIDVKDNLIYLLPKNYKGILVYDINCKYVRTVNLQFIANRIKVTRKNNFIVYKTFDASNFEDNNFFNNLMLIDSTGKIIDKKKPFKIIAGERVFFDVEEPLSSRGDDVLYSECLSDSVMVFDENIKNKDVLLINYSIKSIDKREFKNLKDIQTIFSNSTNKKPTGICYFQDNNNMTSFIFLQNARSCYFLKNKLNQKSVVASYFTVGKNDGYLPIPIYSNENTIMGVIDESSLAGIPFDKATQEKYKDIFNSIIFEGKSYIYFAKLKDK